MPSGGLVTNMSNVAKSNFAVGEQFKVLIPKDKMVKDISVTVKIEAECETYPIFYGESGKSNLQDYALTFSPYTKENTNTTLDILGSNASLKIEKTDEETKQPLKGVKFKVSTITGELIGVYETDKEGIITIDNLYPGVVIIKEIETQNEYVLNTDEYTVTLEWGQTTDIKIGNKQKKGQVEVYKLSEDDNKYTNLPANSPLPETKFELYDEANNILETLITDENRICYFTNVSSR